MLRHNSACMHACIWMLLHAALWMLESSRVASFLQGAEVTVIWETQQPYESVLQSTAQSAVVKGLRLRHSSPSVANNYAVFMQGGSLRLEVSP